MKKQLNLSAAGRKLSLSKRTISNLNSSEMKFIVGGSRYWYCTTGVNCAGGGGNSKNCTQNQNTCPGHKTCWIFKHRRTQLTGWCFLYFKNIKTKKWKSKSKNSIFPKELFLIWGLLKWAISLAALIHGRVMVIPKIVHRNRTPVRVIKLAIPAFVPN